MADPTTIIVNYFVTKLAEEGYGTIKDRIDDLVKTVSRQNPQNPELNTLPSVSLMGFGRCGSNICLNVRDILLRSRESKSDDEGDSDRFGDLRRLVPFIGGLEDDRHFHLSFDPMIVIIDLDIDVAERLAKGTGYERLIPLHLDWSGGAGNVQIVGEYQAARILSKDPAEMVSDNWRNVFTYLFDALLLAVNPTRMYLHIFSTGGGTGSGMSPHFGLAQQHTLQQRHIEVGELPNGGELLHSNLFVFSFGFGILPTVNDPERLNEAVHLNSGRLLCKYLAASLPEQDGHEPPTPWHCLALVSNNGMIGGLRANEDVKVSQFDFENITNSYVAQHIFNLLSAQATAGDADSHDWEIFEVAGGRRTRLDATDLLTSLSGINAIGYGEVSREEFVDGNLLKIFVDAFRTPKVVDTKGGVRYIRGISIVPETVADYNSIFPEDAEDLPEKVKALPIFKRASSVVTILSVPRETSVDASAVDQLGEAVTRNFPNLKINRLAVVKNYSSQISLTMFIGGDSVVLTSECLGFIFAYIRRCFGLERDGAQEVYETLLAFLRACYGQNQEEADKLFVTIESMLLHHERLDEFTAPPFRRVRYIQETSFRTYNSKGFIPMDDFRVPKEGVMKCLRKIQETLCYKQAAVSKVSFLED